MTVAGTAGKRVAQRWGTNAFGLDTALGVENFAFDVLVVGGEG